MKNLGSLPLFFLFAMLTFSINHRFLPGPSLGELILVLAFFVLIPLWPKLTVKQVPVIFGIGLGLLILISISSLLHHRDDSLLRFKTLGFWTLHGTFFCLSYLWLSKNPRLNFQRLLKSLYILGLIVGSLAVFQYAIGPKACSVFMPWGPFWTQWYSRLGFRVYSFFDNPLLLGSVLCMLWPLFLQRAILQEGKKWFQHLDLCIIASAILLTGSRSCFLVVLCITFFQVLPHFKKEHLAGSIIGSTVIVCAVVFLLAFSPVGRRMSQIFSLGGDSNLNQRIVAWDAGVQMLIDYPAFGVGPGYFSEAYQFEYKPVQSQDDPSSFTLDNLIFQIACEFGIPAAFLSCLIFLYYLGHSFGLMKRNQQLAGFFFSFSSFGFLSLGIALYSTPVLWLLMILFSIVSIHIQSEEEFS